MKPVFKIVNLALAVGLTLPASNLLADDFMSGGHPYIGVAAGYGNIIAPHHSSNIVTHAAGSDSVSEQGGGLASSINLGYLWDTQPIEFGAELSYNMFPSTSYSDNTKGTAGTAGTAAYTANSYNLMAVGKVFMTPNVNVFAKFGAAYTMQSFNTSESSESSPRFVNHNSWMPAAAVGFGYDASKHVELNLTGNYIWGNKNNMDNHHIPKQPLASVLAGLTYNF